jgi:hypothetical protein
MVRTIVSLLISGSISLHVYGAEIFRWVDGDGRVNYGDSVPEQYKQGAKKTDQNYAKPTSAQRQEAEARAANEKTKADSRSTHRDSSNIPQAGSLSSSKATQASNIRKSCEEEWKRYLASDACFAPYRNANGSIRAEAFKHCVEVKQPPRCDPEFSIPPPSIAKPESTTRSASP